MEPDTSPPTSRRTRVGSVALGYLGVSWVVLQIVDVLLGMFALPDWVGPAVLVLLLVGLVMVVATAWVQADPGTTRREEAGEVPSDWQVAPADALSALAAGRLPHLTWGRTLVGGAVALSLVFGTAGAYVLLTRTGTLGQEPASGAPGDAARVAVVPFATTGEGLEVYEEGMVELLSTNLEGLGSIHAIDARTVLARWDERVGPGRRADLEEALAVAVAAGASHAVLGSMVSAGRDVRFVAQLHDLSSGERLGEVRQEGPLDGVLGLVDGLSVALAREILGSETSVGETGMRLASITTSSVPALELYLEAEAHYRRGRFADALPLLEQAIAAEPTFALAVMRRAQALGWMTADVPPDSLEDARRAIRPLLDRLAPRDAVLAEGGIIDFADGDPNGVTMLRDFVRRYPDEAEGWYQLSDFLYHLNRHQGGTREEVLGGFDRAVDLGPRFAPYYIHAVEGALIRADSARVDELLDRYRELGGEEGRLQAWRLTRAVVFDTDDGVLSEAASADAAAVEEALGSTVVMTSGRPWRVADVAAARLPTSVRTTVALLLRAGRWREVRGGGAQPAPDRLADLVRDWAGAFDLDPGAVEALVGTAVPDSGAWWIPDDEVLPAVEAMRSARDDGTGADPVLLAHLAERAGELDLAAELFEEESWRYHGPAATWRLARIRDRQGRAEEAVIHYRAFLDAWRDAEPDLAPVVEARAALARLTG